MENLAKEEFSDSKSKNNSKFQTGNKKRSAYVLLLLALVNWVSHFLYFKRMGFYEDDYVNFPSHFGQNLSDILMHIEFHATHWWQGHPLAFVPGVFTFVGQEISEGISILYVIAFIIVTVNSFLMYKILKKVFPASEIFAVTGALMFCLFPSDTIKGYLLGAYVLQTSLMYLLIATLLYLKGWKKLSYLAILMTLFSYESTFMVFFAVPLLKGKWDKAFRKEMIWHVIILCSMIALAFLYRKFTGESRVLEASSDLFSVIYKTLIAMILGPAFNLFLFYRAPIVTLTYWIKEQYNVFWWYYDYIFYFVGAFIFLFIFYFSKLKSDYITKKSVDTPDPDLVVNENRTTNNYLRRIIKLCIISVIMLCLAYGFSFTHYPPTAIMGRMTSVHLAATFGASILFGCICAILFFLAEKYKFKKYAIVALSLYLALLIGYKTYVQKEFVISWEYQKAFWKNILQLVPDLSPNTVIFVDGILRSRTKYIDSHHIYNDMILLEKLFTFPPEWTSHPVLFMVWGNWKEEITQNQNNELIYKSVWIDSQFPLKDSNVVFITTNQMNELTRIDSTMTINGRTLHLKPKTKPTIQTLRKNKLYDYLIRSK